MLMIGSVVGSVVVWDPDYYFIDLWEIIIFMGSKIDINSISKESLFINLSHNGSSLSVHKIIKIYIGNSLV